VEKLKQVLQQTWETISLDVINKLCSGFVRRLRLCFEFQGQSISKHLGLCGAEGAATSWRTDNQLHSPWTPEEEQVIYQVVRTMGMCWVHLERLLPGRTANAIKNRLYSVLQKQEHEVLAETTTMMTIRDRLQTGLQVAEICRGMAD
jgi:hypothetical protein